MPYGAFPNRPGIYKIYFLNPDLLYIGSSVNVRARRKDHLVSLRRGVHPNPHLQKAFSKYGEDALHFEIVEYVERNEDLVAREQYYLDTLKPHYNIRIKAVNAPRPKQQAPRVPWNKGKRQHLTEDARARLSESHKGQPSPMKDKKHTPESLSRMSASLKGLPAWNKGKPWDEANQQRLRTIGLGRPSWNKGSKLGKPSPRKGKPHSLEVRERMIAKQRATMAAKSLEEKTQMVEKWRVSKEANKACKPKQGQLSLWDDNLLAQ